MKIDELDELSPLHGERIYLREVIESDVDGNYLRWMNDIEVTQYLECRFFPATPEDLRIYVRTIRANRNSLFLAMIVKETGEHVGNIKLGPIDWHHASGDIGLIIGEKAYWGKGIAKEAIKLVVNHAFHTLQLHKVTASCYATNVASIRAFERLGFAREGIRKSQFLSNGHYVDQVMLGLVRQSD